MRRTFLLFSLLCFTAWMFSEASEVHAGSGAVPGKYIVKLSKKADPTQLRKSLTVGSRLERLTPLKINPHWRESKKWQRFYVFSSTSDTLSQEEVTSLIGADNIEYIEPDYYLELFAFPDDSLFPHQWYLNNTGQDYYGINRIPGTYNDELVLKSGTPGKDIRIISQYENPPSESTKVVVAIVDTGVDPLHPELQGRLWKNPDEIPGNGIDDDHNGFVDDTLGYDVSGDVIDFFNPTGDNDPTDTYGHGTHIAGIVAANADGKGVVGIAPWVDIMAVKIFPNGTSAMGAAGILYAVNAGAHVINISWGSPFEASVLKEAVDFARHNGVMVCIAPGNSGDNTRFYPAAFDSTFVVAAGNSDGYETDFSTYGAHIDLVAPGLDILSLRATGTDMYGEYPSLEPGVRIIDSLYYLSDGTSMATPMVTGAAALMLSFRPDLTVPELEEILCLGATDLIDPLNRGDTLIGPDTLSGWGYLNIDASLSILLNGGIYIADPIRRNRYTGAVPIKIAPVAGYQGNWRLEYSRGLGSQDWTLLAQGDTLPADSLAFTFEDTLTDGFINFRVTDKFGSHQVTTITYVRQNKTEITSPLPDEELNYNIPIYGSTYGITFDSMSIYAMQNGESSQHLFSSTGEFFDSLMYDWAVSGSDTGEFTIYLYGYYSTETMVDSVTIRVKSAFADGWPQSLGAEGAITPVCGDLDHDGIKELVVGTRNGLVVYRGNDGSIVEGFPVMTGQDMRSVPALYDVDADGEEEIICTNDSGIYVFNPDGTLVDGWPRYCYTGMIPYEYAFPNPVVVQLREGSPPGATPDSGIMIINKLGEIFAYRFNGDSYFYSKGGLFGLLADRLTETFGVGGGTSPFVTAANVDNDPHTFEVVASYTGPYPYIGLGLFQGANGEPYLPDEESPIIQQFPNVFGTVLADLNGDRIPEIITCGADADHTWKMWAKTNGTEDLPGWPVQLPTPPQLTWIGSYPTAADLDLDGIPEVLVTIFEYDIAALCIYKADGSPYLVREGRPPGEAFLEPVTFGTPIVANLLGDDHPEIIFRSGYILPNTGPERVYILDYLAQPVPGWPITTPTRRGQVFSSRFAPLVDDVDNDGLVELALISDANELLVWNFDASVDEGRNTGRFLMNNHNTNVLPPSENSTGINDYPGSSLPVAFALRQNFPNPFNPHTMISFSLPTKAHVTLDVYNLLGQKVTTLVDEELPAGEHRVKFDGSDLASGVYFYRLQAGNWVQTKKMMLLK